MKTLIKILCLSSFIFSLGDRQEILSRYENGNKKVVITYRGSGMNETITKRVKFSEKDQIIYIEEPLTNIEKKFDYYDNGNLKKELSYKNDNQDGIQRFYDTSNSLIEIKYRNNKPTFNKKEDFELLLSGKWLFPEKRVEIEFIKDNLITKNGKDTLNIEYDKFGQVWHLVESNKKNKIKLLALNKINNYDDIICLIWNFQNEPADTVRLVNNLKTSLSKKSTENAVDENNDNEKNQWMVDFLNRELKEEKELNLSELYHKPIKIEFIIVKDNTKTWIEVIDKIDNSLDKGNQSFSSLLSFDREARLTPYVLIKNSNKDRINLILNNQVVNNILRNVHFLWGVENKEIEGYTSLYLLNNYIELNNDDIKFLKAETYPMDHQNSEEWYISLEFSNAKDFEEITADNKGKFLAVILDDEVKIAPRINQKISQGGAQITGSFTSKEAKDIESRFSTFKMLESGVCDGNGYDCGGGCNENVELWNKCYNIETTTKLNLWNNQLKGKIPPEIGNLVNLTTLSLSQNQLSGEIPPEIGNLVNLVRLMLFDNQLSGEIPPEIGKLINLERLSLRNNQLTGEIPPEIENLTNAYQLYLNNNQFCPPYPDCIDQSNIDSQDTSNCP